MTPSRTLARDYKNVRRTVPGGQTFTGWTGLLVGLSIGPAVALGVYLHYRNLAPAQPEPAATVPPASAQASEPDVPVPAADPATDYDFYRMLPEQEVEVSDEVRAAQAANPVRSSGGEVTLQAGSFKGADQAEKMQARLALHGIESHIQRFTLHDETWFRVRIGPVATVEELEALRAKLAEAEVEVAPVSAAVIEVPPP
jgi:cell division protein FtsN